MLTSFLQFDHIYWFEKKSAVSFRLYSWASSVSLEIYDEECNLSLELQ